MIRVKAIILLIVMLQIAIPWEAIAFQTTGYGIKQVYSAMAKYDSVAKSLMVPARAYGPNAVKTIALNVPAAKMAKLMYTVAAVAGVVALGMLEKKLDDYMQSKGYGDNPDGVFSKKTPIYEPLNSGDIYQYAWTAQNGIPAVIVGVYANNDIAKMVVESAQDSEGSWYQYGSTWCNAGYQDTAPARWDQTKYRGVYRVCYSNSYRTVLKNAIVAVYPLNISTVKVKGYEYSNITEADKTNLETSITTDINNGSSAALNGADAAVHETEKMFSDPQSKIANSPQAKEIKTMLDSLITAAQKTLIDQAAKPDPDTAADDAVKTEPQVGTTISNVTNNNTTNNTTNNTYNGAAVGYNATVPAYTGGTATQKDAYILPETMPDFSTRFNQFMTTLKETPLFSIPGEFGQQIPAGECSMTVNLGETFGGEQVWSMCEWSWLAILKMCFLCVASYMAARIVILKG